MAGAPFIDVSPLLRTDESDAGAVQRVADEIGSACREWGFFQVVGHGVPDDLSIRFNEQVRAFFSAPRRVKDAVFRTPDNSRGFFDDELTKRRRDWKECFDFGLPGWTRVDGENRWPDPAALPEFRGVMTDYFDAMNGIAAALTSAIARSLGLEPDSFSRALGDRHSSFLRLNYYPECPDPESNMGISPHNDAGMLTVLLQDDVGGLQVERGGQWVDIPPIEGAYVVNVGDMMQIFSNDEIRSPTHRVLAPQHKKRYSAPFFYNPAYDTVCEPLAGLVTAERPAAYRPCRWEEFRGRRIAGDVKDLGEEVQIKHYRPNASDAVA